MNIENLIEDTKKKSALVNGLAIDWQYIQQLVPQILNKTDDNTTEFKNACNSLTKILDRTEEGIRELKNMIPNYNETNGM